MRFLLLVVVLGCAHRSGTIDLQLASAPVDEALRAVAAKAKINLSVDADVTGTVTIDARDRPWREVLDAIAAQRGLHVSRAGETLRISTHPVPDRSYTGARITFHVDGVPIRDAIAELARLAHARITVDDDLEIAVTQHARGVPWDLVLDHIARKYGLRLIGEPGGFRLSQPGGRGSGDR